ncbi:TetR family transcriptional regulator [Myceligenerans indicum]|uniref:TetR/AcrR family transcriptional regulator n=1 Tax=Myceligenerans indicum TaxID=2593663 RepID=A0ABS1LLL5_9MICO|nr:TetR family transcriptional regulator [Myceligenerans indicum]MBL0887142.1 TetR/AcrR family transcriptional regulator [Myceligenerans indicum]
MATRDSEATKRRILGAATTEFAEHGLAGARVDRIAQKAAANKQLIYAYFGGKEELFDHVLGTSLTLLLDTVPFTASDLPAYAGALFDFAVANPQLVRLMRWHQLERPGVLDQLPAITSSTLRKLDALDAAQRAGEVTRALPAGQLLALLLALIHGGAEATIDSGHELAIQRETLVTGVRRLVAPS